MRAPRIKKPVFAAAGLAVLALMVLLFLFGENLPTHLLPPSVAIIGATLALLAVYSAKVEPVDEVLRAVDWKTLVFIAAIMCLMQGFTKTGLLQGLSLKLHGWFGTEFALVALALLAGIGLLSRVLANIPVVPASVVMAKGYLVAAEAVPEIALGPGFADWPAATLPVFGGMMFGGTLGGNATLIGARADEPFEAFLLEVLSDFQVTVPELGVYRAPSPPIAIITSNRTREIHDAVKRRCLYHWVDYPDAARELAILERKAPAASARLARDVVAFVQRLRRRALQAARGR